MKPLKFTLGMILSIQSVFAQSQAKSTTEMLEDLERDMQAHYPEILSVNYDQLAQSEMTRRLGDFHNAVALTAAGVVKTLTYLDELNRVVQQDSGEGWSEKRFYATNWTRHSARKLVSDAQVLGQSVDQLENYWQHRCDPAQLKAYLDLYDPIVMFPRDNFGSDIPLQKPPLYLSFSVQTSTNGQMQGGSAGFASNADAYDAAIVTTATYAGTVIGTAFPVVGNIIGGFIGAIVGSIIVYFRSAFKAHSDFEDQAEIRERIRKQMISAVEALSARRGEVFANACRSLTTPERDAEVLNTLRVLKNRQVTTLKSTTQLSDYLESEYAAFPKMLTAHLQNIESGYLTELATRMSENQETFLNNELESDRAAIQFKTKVVFPLLREQKNAFSVLNKLESRDRLWRSRVRGDAAFGTGERSGPWLESSEDITSLMKDAI